MEKRIDEWFAFASKDDSVGRIDQAAAEVRQREGVKLGAFVVIAKGDCVALVQLSYGTELYGGFPWNLPGGGVSPGELPVDAARREVREETGLELPPERMKVAAVFHRPYVTNTDGQEVGELTLLYCCRADKNASITPNSPEILATAFVKFDVDHWLAVPAVGSGQHLQPMRRHWIYWTQLGMQKLETNRKVVKVWTYAESSDLALPID